MTGEERGEPDAVTLPGWAVENLRARLARCLDETLTDKERHDERRMLVGALAYHLLHVRHERDVPR